MTAKKHPQKRIFWRFRVKKGAFWGGKLHVGGNTPKRVYYHRMGALGGLFGANLSAKSAKKAPKTESGVSTHLCFGLIWGDLVARLLPFNVLDP